MKLNFLYQFHNLFVSKVVKQEITPIQKDSGELKFVYSFTAEYPASVIVSSMYFSLMSSPETVRILSGFVISTSHSLI